MGDSQHTSQLNFKSNMAPLQALKQKMDEAFGVSRFKAFSGAIRDAQNQVKSLAKEHDGLVSQMAKVKEGSDAYKTMATNLKEVEKQAAAAQRQIERMQTAQSRTGVGRMAQGAGMAMAGGTAAAYGGYKAAGAAGYAGMAITGAQGLNPIAQAMGPLGIPMMTAVQAYGSYLQREQAAAAAMPYMLKTGARAPLETGPNKGFLHDAEIRRTEATILQQKSTDYAEAHPMAGGTVHSRLDNPYAAQEAPGQTVRAKAAQLYKQAEDARVEAEKAEQKAATKGAGRNIGFDVAAFGRQGIQMGYTPQEALQMVGQMAQSAGPVGTDTAQFGMAAQRRFGIGMGESGAAMRGVRRTGGGGEQQQAQALAMLIGEATAKELTASEMNDAIQQQTQFLEQQARYGTKLDVRDLVGAESKLQGAGVSGFMAGPMAQQIMSSVSGRFREGGGRSALDIAGMRELGYTGSGGSEEFAKYQNMMQDPSSAGKATFGMLGKLQGMGGMGPEMKALMAQRVMQRFAPGVEFGINQAKGLMGLDGGPGIRGAVGRSPGDQTEFMSQIVEEAKRRTPGTLAAEAGIEGQRIDAGAGMAGAVQSAQRSMLHMATAFDATLGPAVDTLAKKMEKLSSNIDVWAGENGPFKFL